MPVQTTYPGVYVQEVPSGVRTIVGVSTSIAMFIGRAKKGKTNEPLICTSLSDFEREFSMNSDLSEMPQQVKLFFENGGTKCYAMSITDGTEIPASITLMNEAKDHEVLKVTSKQPGNMGNLIRIEVTYTGQNPEVDFNMNVIQYEIKNGVKVISETENYKNLSMDEHSLKYVQKQINQKSKLIEVKKLGGGAPINGYSLSGRIIEHEIVPGDDPNTAEKLQTAIKNIVTDDSCQFNIQVDDFSPVSVNLNTIADNLDVTSLANFIADFNEKVQSKINSTLLDAGASDVAVTVNLVNGPSTGDPNLSTKQLKITSTHKGDVLIFPSSNKDIAVPFMLGTAQGGLEVGAYSNLRPVPTGISFNCNEDNLKTLAGKNQNKLKNIILTDDIIFHNTGEASKVYKTNDGAREKLRLLRDAINEHKSEKPRSFFWKAELSGYRLSIIPTQGEENKIDHSLATSPEDIKGMFTNNVRYYCLGDTGLSDYQVKPGIKGIAGNPPDKVQYYENAFKIIEKEVDLFNLLVLAKDKNSGAVDLKNVYGKASTFCQKKRAFLLMDAPDWANVQDAVDGVTNLRIGLVKDHSAIFYPKIKIRENGTETEIGPSGAIAGLMARTDSNRGVWKAPAGTEADIRGISGINLRFTDGENGILNPRAINTIRNFPNGIVNWGARTMDGDDDFQSEYKYIPVRRLALYMEESLYRGLKWVVFEPNDEPLWSQIRLNVGAFMHDLFRQGAFQGTTPKEAYFVKCDKETTTQNDINLGRVNIHVGFAPLKPAEFVILYLQQIAGQVQS